MLWFTAGFSMAACCLLAGVAHAAVEVRKVSELDSDDKVQHAAKRYRVFASASVIYEQCGHDYPAIAVDRDYVQAQFAEAETAYRDAYRHAYTSRVGFPPDVPTEQNYVTRIRNTQQAVINNTANAIQKEGCRRPAIKNIVDFVTKARRPATPPKED